jgi:hypothetical protein
MGTPYAPGSDTSKAAADVAGQTASTVRASVFRFVDSQGEEGATDHEIRDALGLRIQTVVPRRGELRARGYLEDSGRRRLTDSGSKATVWIAVPPGLRVERAREASALALARKVKKRVGALSAGKLEQLLSYLDDLEAAPEPVAEEPGEDDDFDFLMDLFGEEDDDE